VSILYTSYTCVVMHWAMSIVRLGVCFDIVWSVMLPYCTNKISILTLMFHTNLAKMVRSY